MGKEMPDPIDPGHPDQINALVARILSGDKAAWHPLVDTITPVLWREIACKVSSREDALDVFQETWIKITLNLNMFNRDCGSFSTWVRSIADHAATDFLRRRRRITSTYSGEEQSSYPPSGPSKKHSELHEFRKRVLETLSKLTNIDKRITDENAKVAYLRARDNGESITSISQNLSINYMYLYRVINNIDELIARRLRHDYPELEDGLSDSD